jgi:hypothetical protein
MMIIVKLRGRDKWKMISRMTIQCFPLIIYQPNPTCESMGMQNCRSFKKMINEFKRLLLSFYKIKFK